MKSTAGEGRSTDPVGHLGAWCGRRSPRREVVEILAEALWVLLCDGPRRHAAGPRTVPERAHTTGGGASRPAASGVVSNA
jgi:hypothetical protein